jgi:UDP-N-acetyl-2-amino-2-deoxyglucuronate dehydrogenase
LATGGEKPQDRAMNFGIIGTGMIAGTHAKAIRGMAGGTLHSVFNHRPEGAQQFAEAYGITAISSMDGFLADPALDIVTVCTPSGAHFEPALAAIRAGKHVIVEKPLEVTLERVDELISAAEQHGVSLASVLNRRFTPAMDAFKKAVDDGRFGRLTSASCYVKWFRDQAYYDSAEWRGTWALDGGGVLMNQAIHAIDALIHLAGPVVAVQANCACLAHEGIEVEDTAVALVEFANGARGVIEGSTCTWSKDGHPVRVQLAGTDGSVFLADESFEVWDFRDERPEDAAVHAGLMKQGSAGLGANIPSAIGCVQHQRNFEEIVAAIREGRESATSAKAARRAIAVIVAIYQSACRGGERITTKC